ncbi:MAG: arogenate dehydrogenase [Pelotomaculum sp. PtaB.Bin104]|nr:MAG: arogenate dehydrogenase [Pelotomaculum sp. PtaB.Bin104]
MIALTKPSIAVVGAGKVGSAIALLLNRQGYQLTGVADMNLPSAKRVAEKLKVIATTKPEEITASAGVVFITTPDRAIAQVAREINERGGFKSGQVVFHTSGSQPAEVLGVARKAMVQIASLHPLQSFANVDMAMENLLGSYFALEGDPDALRVAEDIVRDLGGKCFSIDAQDKPLYHAAACIASNYLVSLMHLATGLYGRFGLSRPEAFKALLPLVQGTIKNISQVGPARALTGPVARGDDVTLEGHLAALKEIGALELELYQKLGLYTIKLALENGDITSDQGDQLKEIFEGA